MKITDLKMPSFNVYMSQFSDGGARLPEDTIKHLRKIYNDCVLLDEEYHKSLYYDNYHNIEKIDNSTNVNNNEKKVENVKEELIREIVKIKMTYYPETYKQEIDNNENDKLAM